MLVDWRSIWGPALTLMTAALAYIFDRLVIGLPNPAPVFICLVAFATASSGLVAGLVTAALSVLGTAVFFFNHRQMPGYELSDLARLLMLAATAAATAGITGLLRKRWIETLKSERRHHATAERLSAALDQVDIGIVLLDADTRAVFINRAFRDYFSLPDEKADTRPPFIALMYHGRDAGAFELPEEELGSFIAQRTEMMRVGDSTPINIDLADGQVLRFSCTALPDGGRMLSYTPVTDLVRHTDSPALADHYRSLRGRNLRNLPPLQHVPPLTAAE